MKSSNKTILVTGAAGFLGSHLCDSLIKQGNHVIGLDNFLTGNPENIAHLERVDKFSFIEADVTNPINIKCDEIFNLACPASPVHYQSEPIQTIKTSIFGAYNLLELARKYHCKILHASTSEVYGDPLEHPQRENYWGNVNPIGERSCYDEGKRAAETLFYDYKRKYSLDIKVVRIFNTYGPKMQANDGRVVSNFIVQALRGDPITIYGNGSQTRSFCYVDDLIKGFNAFMNKDIGFGPINLGNPIEYSIREIANKILKLSGSNSLIINKALPSDDPKRRRPDISVAKKLLDWEPRVSLDEGLIKTFNYFKALKK